MFFKDSVQLGGDGIKKSDTCYDSSLYKYGIGLPWWSSGWESASSMGTQILSLVWEDTTCPMEAKPVCQNY